MDTNLYPPYNVSSPNALQSNPNLDLDRFPSTFSLVHTDTPPPEFQIMWRRLIVEDPGVEGVCWWAKRREDPGHVAANVTRIITLFALSPLLVLPQFNLPVSLQMKPYQRGRPPYNPLHAAWVPEMTSPIEVVLSKAPGGENKDADSPEKQHAVVESYNEDGHLNHYEPSAYEPKFIYMVTITIDGLADWKQMEFSAAKKQPGFLGYTAISYSMDSALALPANEYFKDLYEARKIVKADREKAAKLKGKKDTGNDAGPLLTLVEREQVSLTLLREYCKARRVEKPTLEYIWLDEICLADEKDMAKLREETVLAAKQVMRATEGGTIPPEIKKAPSETTLRVREDRKTELSKLADIFRGAAQVCVFCEKGDCDHTDLQCQWGKRLFTLAEILHAKKVLVMSQTAGDFYITPRSGDTFRAQMQHQAAMGKLWHLQLLLQSATNAGSYGWQEVIHSLIVEAIRRDDATNYRDHTLLASGLNGLLPRRAKVKDLVKKNDGWANLAWLLELNQGFYNTASLAAVCGFADGGTGWLGPPIKPREGNERLEPLTTAFPVRREVDGREVTPLSILGATSIGLYPSLKRDANGLYNSPEKRIIVIRIIATLALIPGFIGSVVLLALQRFPIAIALLWLVSVPYVFLELVVGTFYVERCGWVFIPNHEARPGHTIVDHLKERDRHILQKGIAEWGKRQLIPQWDAHFRGGGDDTRIEGILVDLENTTYTTIKVTRKPNSMVVLAIHGSGVTCMLLDCPTDRLHGVANKCGMVNVPPYVLQKAEKAATVFVGSSEIKRSSSSPSLTNPVDLLRNRLV